MGAGGGEGKILISEITKCQKKCVRCSVSGLANLVCVEVGVSGDECERAHACVVVGRIWRPARDSHPLHPRLPSLLGRQQQGPQGNCLFL